MIRKGVVNDEHGFMKQASAVRICLLVIGLFLSGVCSAQSTAFPAHEQLTAYGRESRSEQQLLADLLSARQALDSHPDSVQTYVSLGRVLKALGEADAASKAFDRALELNANLAEALFEKGSLLADQGEWSKAADLFHRAVAASPDYALAHLALGEMMLRTGEFEGSASELKTVLHLDPGNAGAHQGLGLIHMQEGELDRAIDEFRHALAIRPGYMDAEKSLGHALAYAHKWPEAAKVLSRVVAANPNGTGEIVSLGAVLAGMDDKTGAEAQYARARELSSKETILLRAKGNNNWGVALRKEGKLEDAAAALRRALDEDPSFCEAHDNLGGVFWMQKDIAAALSEFQGAVRCDPDSAMARNNLGTSLLSYAVDIDSAIVQFRAAVALRPGFALAHFNLGKALAAKQDFAQAEPEFRRAIMIDPDLAAAHVGLGLLLATKKSNVCEEARTEMKNGLRLDPALRELIPQQYLTQLQ